MLLHALLLVLVLGGLGLVLGVLLAAVNRKLAVPINPLIEEVEEELPKGQCGACGFPGCAQYAEAVVTRPEVTPDRCTPGGPEVARVVARLTGKAAAELTPRKAVVLCRGIRNQGCAVKHLYEGLDDCAAANMLYGGDMACEYGCLGYGTCVRACPYDALELGEDELPVVDPQRCVGCGICVDACPRGVIALVPIDLPVTIRCRNRDGPAQVKKACSAGCLACSICERTCPHDAIEVIDNLAVVHEEVCKRCQEPVCLVSRCKPGCVLPNHGYIVPDVEPPKLRPKKKKAPPSRGQSASVAGSESAGA